MIICPICKNKLKKFDRSFICLNKHTFDISKSGYINLSLKQKTSGDNKELVESRIDFLNKDFYKPLKNYINTLLLNFKNDNLLDMACGNGYYSKDFLSNSKYGVDLSKDAINYASKHDKSSTYIIASIFDLPFNDKSFDVITTIFAPVSKNEIIRLLKDDGIFIFVSPNSNHLYEFKNAIYKKAYLNKTDILEIKNLNIIKKDTLEYKIKLNNKDILNLFNMTPYKYKTSKEDILKINNIDFIETTISFNITIYKKYLY